MTVKYHGTPLTPNDLLLSLRGRNFCVSFHRPDQVEVCHRIGQSVLLDNGAFSKFTALRRELDAAREAGEPISDDDYHERLHQPVDWKPYYAFCEQWLAHASTWAVIPDVIDGASQIQDGLLKEWPFGERGAPVWHMDEPIERLLRLLDEWPRVCIGSTGEYWRVLSDEWRARMDATWDAVAQRHRLTPWVHMLRGMQLVEHEWPFASVDSTDLARNHNRLNSMDDKAWAMKQKADRWDGRNCPPTWRLPEPTLFEGRAA